MAGKFNSILYKKVEEDRAFSIEQERIRKKHKIEEDVIVVEKSNTFKFLIKCLATILQMLFSVTLIGCALIGLMAMVYPGPRMELQVVWQEVIRQLADMIPF